MGRRGPKPAPEAVKKDRGTYQGCRDSGGLAAPVGNPRPPAWMNEDELAVWDATIAILNKIEGLVSPLDSNAIARYCADVVEYQELRNTIESEGCTVMSEKGGMYAHPAVYMKNAAHDRMRRFEALFGMTASDRAALKLSPSKPQGVRTRQRA